jgi:hypothetical protein
VRQLRRRLGEAFPAFGRKSQEEENEGAGLAPSCSPSQSMYKQENSASCL